MSKTISTRRDLLRAAPTACLAGAAILTSSEAVASEPTKATYAEWTRLHTAYEAAFAEERLALRAQDDCLRLFYERRREEPEPDKLTLGPIDRTRPLADLVADTETPEWKRRWADYEQRHATWQARQDALRTSIMREADDRSYDAVHATDAAYATILAYQPTSLTILAKKAALMQRRSEAMLEEVDAPALIRDIQHLATEARS